MLIGGCLVWLQFSLQCFGSWFLIVVCVQLWVCRWFLIVVCLVVLFCRCSVGLDSSGLLMCLIQFRFCCLMRCNWQVSLKVLLVVLLNLFVVSSGLWWNNQCWDSLVGKLSRRLRFRFGCNVVFSLLLFRCMSLLVYIVWQFFGVVSRFSVVISRLLIVNLIFVLIRSNQLVLSWVSVWLIVGIGFIFGLKSIVLFCGFVFSGVNRWFLICGYKLMCFRFCRVCFMVLVLLWVLSISIVKCGLLFCFCRN